MKSKRKIVLSLVLTMVLLVNGACIRAEAYDKIAFESAVVDEKFIELLATMPETLFEQYSNIIDIQTMTLSGNERSNEGVEAYEYDDEGFIRFVDCEATVTRIVYREDSVLPMAEDENVSSIYVLTANTDKKSDDSTEEDGVTLTGCITWIDHLGTSNELVSLSGSRAGDYINEGKYICTSRTHGVVSGEFDGESFVDNSKKGEKGYSFTLIVRSQTASNTTVQLMVKTSAFD